ncbi:TetR/AcrR family transcriptional regulator [Anaeromyxobacter dehalogenans]|uniref:TetR/AcrR family transcriptional regulator n=1 Tax=Anaeromyxobacter dehalogenans TaxID=161493 RepID=UPI0009D73E30|nr:TetR/AcrR family transcriptional regulator [Anaeromyxobacter dehalogenans]
MSRPPRPATVAPRRGRPRSDAARQAILTAALELARTRPPADVSVEAIAAQAGVGKQTIYRWWRGKAEVLLEALADLAEAEILESDMASLEADVRAFLEASFDAIEHQRLAPVLRGLMAEAQRDPGFARAFRARFIERRRDAARRLLDRARRRGELGRSTDPELLVDVLFGALWYRLLVGHAPLDRAFARGLARAVARVAR